MKRLNRWMLLKPLTRLFRNLKPSSTPISRPVRLQMTALEDRTVPDGRPLPLPFLFVGAATGAPPLVRAYNAETGALVFERQPFDVSFTGGVRVSAGDINNDGIPDLIAAAGPGGGPHIVVYDGTTGDAIAGALGSFYAYGSGFTGGVYVASGDVDGDGWADVITSAGPGAGPHVKVFSGRTAQELASFYAFAPSFAGGATIAAADFTGDGKADLVVGAGAGAGPHVKIFDLASAEPIAGPLGSFYAFDPAIAAGVDVGTDFLAGDITGDGRADLVVGLGAGVASRVRVYDGHSGVLVSDFSPFGAGMTAGVRVAAAYVDDDPFADIVVGTGAGVAGTVKVFDGVTLEELPAPMSPYTPFGESYTGGLFVGASNDPPVYGGSGGSGGGTVWITGDQDGSETDPSGSGRGWFIVHRSDTNGSVTVSYAAPAGSATPGADYSGLASGGGSVTIADGQDFAYLYVIPADDALVEGTEMVTVTLTGAGGYAVTGGSASIAIVDNDTTVPPPPPPPPPLPSVSIQGTLNANETDPAVAGRGRFTVTRSSGAGALTVTYAAPTGTATVPSDYSGPTAGGGSVSFASGVTSVTLDVVPVDDASNEGNETVTLTLNPSGSYALGTPSATITIVDNDVPTVTIAATLQAGETDPTGAGRGRFTITRSLSVGALTVNYAAPTGTATVTTDYSGPIAGVGSVSFANGVSSITLDVIPVDDAAYEGPETVVLSLVGGGGYYVGTPASATVTIADNDLPTVSIARSQDGSETDPTGAGRGRFLVSRNGTFGSTTVYYGAPTGTAAPGDDYSSPAGAGSVAIAAGSYSAYLDVTPVNDTAVEPTETVAIALTAHAGYHLGTAAATIDILDNDTPVVWVGPVSQNVAEGGTGTIAINRRDGDTSLALTVNLGIGADGQGRPLASSADYTLSGLGSTGGTITFAANQTSIALTAAATLDNRVEETEGFRVSVLAPSDGPNYFIGAPADFGITDVPVIVDAGVATQTAPEGGAGAITLTRTGGDTTQALTVTLGFGLDGHGDPLATAGGDYTLSGATGNTVTFAANQTSLGLTFVTELDNLVEGTEGFRVTPVGGSTYLSGVSADVRITDLPAQVWVSPVSQTVAEGGSGGFWLERRSGDTSEALTVDLAFGIDGFADPLATWSDDYRLSVPVGTVASFGAGGGTVAFAPNQTSLFVFVEPQIDTVTEETEGVRITVVGGSTYQAGFEGSAGGGSGGGTGSPGGSATADIRITDVMTAWITGDQDTTEGGTAGWFSVHRTSGLGALTVNYSAPGGSATNGVDHTGAGAGGGSVSFASGETTKQILIAPVDDAAVEDTETVTLALTAGGGYAVGGGGDFINLFDNDFAVPILEDQVGGEGVCEVGLAGAAGAGITGGITKTSSGVESNGTVRVALASVGGEGFGASLSNAISWSNAAGYAAGTAGGGTQIGDWGRIADTNQGNGSVALITSSNASVNFASSGGGFTTPFGFAATLTLDATAHEYTVTGGDGGAQVYHDLSSSVASNLRGQLKSKTDAAGNATAVTARDGSGRPVALEKTDSATGETERLAYTYSVSGQVATITRQRKPSGGSFATVRSLELSYATPSGALAPALVGTVEKDGSGTVLGETYNRYYASGSTAGYAGALKFHLGDAATARLKQAYGGTALAALTNAQVAEYSDNFLEYDSSHRVTKSVTAGAGCSACNGGQGTATIAYATRTSGGYGVNDWKTKVTETLDDGTVTRKYAGASGQTILTAVTEPSGLGNTWITYTRYHADGQIAFTAAPSAVSGYDETKADLVDYAGGSSAAYLRDSEGLITTYTYGASTTATGSTAGDVSGYLKSVAIQRGESGTALKQSETLYISRTAAGTTTYHTASETQYRNDNGTGGQTTTTAYTWQGSTHRIASTTATLPTVTSGQNGSGTAATLTTVYDGFGRAIWSKDAAGVLSYTGYDAGTGAVVKSIADVNTANTSDFANLPSGWSTPGGAGLHLLGTFEVDSLGRTTKSVDPLGNINYTVYLDTNDEVRTYSGWNTSTNLPTGSISVYRDNRTLGYSETLTMSATPSVSSGRPTGAESIAGIQSLSRSYRNAAGQTTHSDNYFDLTGVTYSTAINIGTQNANFYRTQMGYDKKGQVNKTVSAAGTITRTENDSLGRSVSTWVGTDDTPTTGFWSTTNLAGTNMVKVAEVEYDGGGVGDSNATKMTMYPGGGAANRVSQTFYDWRGRAVASKSGVETSESTSLNRPIVYMEYDNFGAAIVSEVYDGDAVAVVDAGGDGVPDRPSASLLRAKTAASTDELGRAYKTETYSVDPITGTVSIYALTSQVWFDLRGLTLKSVGPGGLVQKTAFDSLGRATTTYFTDGGGDIAWSDANDVTGDTVLSQSEMTYDADGNVLLSVSRERFHDASGTGALGTPGSGIAAQVSYSAAYYDKLNRMTDSVNVGTNGASAYTRPGSVPSRSDTMLVSSVEYDAAGRQWKTVDPRGLESRTTYDLLGRTTKTVVNYADGTVSDLDDKTTEYTYSAAGMTSLTAKLTGGGGQTTEWVYGVGSGSGVVSNDIVGTTKWPDPTTGASSSGQQETATVNALGQTLTCTDRNGSTHTLGYDVLGRIVSDAVTTLGSGVDVAVRRIETAYDSQGNAYLLTSYDAAISGSIVNQVQRAFDGLGNLTGEWQSHSGTVNTSTTTSVQYGYSTVGTSNQVRLTSMTYPNGRVIGYNYASGLDGTISRLTSITDGGITLESYDYLGFGMVVERAHPQTGVDLSYVKLSGESVGDAGDQYTGLDRFGRIVDQRWRSGSTDVDRNTYTYDRDSNRLAKTDSLNSALSEVYTYDGLNQIESFNRGSGTRTQNFDYDALGNRDGVTTNGSTQTYTANKQNEITSISGATTPTYDANGNMTGDETGKLYVYDTWNRLVTVKNNGGVTLKTYGYDALNRRVSETATGTTTDLYYSSNWQVLEERVAGAVTASYIWSPVYIDAMIARDRDTDGNGTLDERLYPTHDANFNVTALANASGSVVERHAYDTYGAVTVMNVSWSTVSGTAYGWQHLHQGGRLDSTSGLAHFRNRDFSQSLGIWTSMDSERYGAGDYLLYRYEGNAPINNLDWSGKVVVFFKGYAGPGGSSNSSGSLQSIASSSIGSFRMFSESNSSGSRSSGSGLPGGSSAGSSAGGSSSSGPDDKSGGPYPLYNFADKKYEYSQVNDAVKFIIDRVGESSKCKEPIVIIGHSWGGDSAIRTALKLKDKGYNVDLLVTLDPITHTLNSFYDADDTKKPGNVKLAWNYYQDQSTPNGSSMTDADINEKNFEGTIRDENGKTRKGIANHKEIDDTEEIATKTSNKAKELNKKFGIK